MVVRERTRRRLRASRSRGISGAASGRSSWSGLLREALSLFRIALPITLAQLGGIAMTTLDTVMVGALGAEALAALGLASSLHVALLVVTTGTLFGMAPMVSQAFGTGDRLTAQHVLVHGFWIALALSIPVVGVNLIGEPIAVALGQESETAGAAGDYMAALAWGVPPMLLFVALRQYLEGMSLTKPAMVITLGGLVVNFFANLAFIYGIEGLIPSMGAVGAGWATSLVRWVMFIVLVAWVTRQPALAPARRVVRSFRPELARRIVQIGFPTGIQLGLETGFFAFTAVMMGWLGGAELGTHQVAINLASTTFMVALGFSIAGSIRVGQQIGAGNVVETQRSVLVTYGFAIASMAVFALLFLTIPASLIGLYTSDPAVIELGVSLLFVAAIFQVFDGAQVAGFSVLRGAADTRVPMLIAGAAYWLVGAPAAYLLGFRTSLGPLGVWSGMVVGLVTAAVLLGLRVRQIHWRRAVVSVWRAPA